ncbi:kinase-like protein [Choiromyces venosus 120613-1]|uniref:non-specific serine/threonine protein kinase n=1 Tax=Choiromyces venosus 120613-1 TaxID=1336337 RepID=A0A3N4JSN8_9PEZI|nr:kinase-like protein [Choiromyces venosus 120613-1]
MNDLQSDIVESYRLETEFDGNHVRHTRHSPGTRRRVKEEWTVGEALGHGGFSVVHKHLQERTGQLRAVKTIEKSKYPFYSREFLIMAILAKHRSLFVEFLGWFENEDRIYTAMEYFGEGDLRKHLSEPLQEELVGKITKQLIEGLEIMHAQDIAHRDLKPEVSSNFCDDP